MFRRARILIGSMVILASSISYAAVVNIQLNGVPKEIVQTIANSTSLSSIKLKKPTEKRVQLLFQRSYQQISSALSAYGYFRASVQGKISKSPSSKQDSPQWDAVYNVKLGPPLRITKSNIDIEGPGKEKYFFKTLVKHSHLKAGDVLTQSNYSKLKSDLLNKAVTKGYFDAKLTQHEMRIDIAQYFAIVNLTLDTGPRYTFGKTTFVQTGYPFKESFLRRYLTYAEGQPYNLYKSQKLQSNLSASQYFSEVNVQPKPTIDSKKNAHKVPVKVTLQTQKRQQYTLGLGYGTETSVRATLGANYRYLNDTGSHLKLQAQVSKIYSQVTAAYIIPGANPMTDYTSINGGQNYTNILPYTANTSLFGVDVSKNLGRWQRTLSLHQYYIRYVSDADAGGKAYYLTPQFDLAYLNRKKKRYWYSGFSVDWLTSGAVKKVLSKTSYLKSILSGRISEDLTRSTRFFVMGSAGGIMSKHIDDLSPTLRFYSGGMGSVRGYKYKSLSPLNSDGKETGGRFELLGSANLEQHLFGNISGIVFYDRGNSFNSLNNFKLFAGAGLGFSYQSPVGPIRLYFSHPINEPKSRWRIDFTIGTFL